MGLADRHYMRSSPFEMRRSATATLLITLLVVFLVQSFLILYARWPLLEWLGLSRHGLGEMRLWQLFTFQFLHDWPWPWHLLFNCIALYFFGRSVEEALGRRSMLRIYFLGGFFGGLLQILTTLLPRHPDYPVVGASAGVAGLLAAFATLFPDRQITYLFFFFPITFRAQLFLWIALFISIYGTIVPFGGVAHAAHLGGLLTGLAYVRWGVQSQRHFANWHPFQSRQRKRELVKAASVRGGHWRNAKPETEDLPPEEFISKEVDPILDKISAHGIQSLTERERRILEAARKKMAKR